MVPLEIPAGSGRRLAALHHPPTGPRRNRAVLIINPLGQEAVRAHRLLRVLADRLARNGVDVLRFDLHGCGDSSGDDLDGEMKGWQDDVLAAHRWLLDHTGVQAVGWLGIRLGFAIGWQAAAHFEQGRPDTAHGATPNAHSAQASPSAPGTPSAGQDADQQQGGLRAGAAASQVSASQQCRQWLTEGPAPDRLIGWDPVVVGNLYLDALWRDHKAAVTRAFSLPTVPDRLLRRQRAEGDLSEAMGFALSPRLLRQIRALDQQDWTALPVPRVAVLQSNAALPWPAARRAPAMQLEAVDVDFDWTSEEALNTPLVPDAALRRLVPWLSLEAEAAGAPADDGSAVPVQQAAAGAASRPRTQGQQHG